MFTQEKREQNEHHQYNFNPTRIQKILEQETRKNGNRIIELFDAQENIGFQIFVGGE